MKTETRAVENELLDEAPDGKQLKVLTHKLITHGRDTGDDPDTQNISTISSAAPADTHTHTHTYQTEASISVTVSN